MVTVAHALVRAASRLVSTPVCSSTGIDMSVDAARVGACATNCIVMLSFRQATSDSLEIADSERLVSLWKLRLPPLILPPEKIE